MIRDFLQLSMWWGSLRRPVFAQPNAEASHTPDLLETAYKDGFTAGVTMGSKAGTFLRTGDARAAFLRGFEEGEALYENSW